MQDVGAGGWAPAPNLALETGRPHTRLDAGLRLLRGCVEPRPHPSVWSARLRFPSRFPSFIAQPAVQATRPRDTQKHQRATAPPVWQPCTLASWAVGDAFGPSRGQPGLWLRAHSLAVQSSARIRGLSPEAWWVEFCFFVSNCGRKHRTLDLSSSPFVAWSSSVRDVHTDVTRSQELFISRV